MLFCSSDVACRLTYAHTKAYHGFSSVVALRDLISTGGVSFHWGVYLLTHKVVSIDQALMGQLNSAIDLFFLTEIVSHTCPRTETVVVSIGT